MGRGIRLIRAVALGVLVLAALVLGGRGAQAQSTLACSLEGDLSLCISTDKQVYGEGEPVTMTLALINVSAEPVDLLFFDACTADFFVSAAGGGVVWDTLDSVCALVILPVTLQPGESMETPQPWDQRDESGNQVAPGSYLVWGVSNHDGCFGFFGFCTTPAVTIRIGSDVTEEQIDIKPDGTLTASTSAAVA